MFGFSPDTIFGVDTFAKRAVTVSSIAAGIGIGIDAWFLFAYSGADVRKFQVSAFFACKFVLLTAHVAF